MEMKTQTLADYLSEKIGAPIGDGWAATNIKVYSNASELETQLGNENAALRYAVASDLTRRIDELGEPHSEDFSIRPLPANYSREEIVRHVKDFYEAKRFEYDERGSDLNWWATLFFNKNGGEFRGGTSIQATLSDEPTILAVKDSGLIGRYDLLVTVDIRKGINDNKNKQENAK